MNTHRDTRALGKFGENIAAKYLSDKGYAIIRMNYTVRGGEIDIVAEKDNILVFVEVKTRRSDRFGAGIEAVDSRKIGRMILAADRFLYDNRDEPYVVGHFVRYDAIEIYTQPESIRHIENMDVNYETR